MGNENNYLHEVVITAIIVKNGKYLITRRSKKKKRFPGMWTVPGGRLDANDYLKLKKDTEHYWYNVLERTLRREIKEEVGIDIDNIGYVTSLATVHTDGAPSIVISCDADYTGGRVKLQKDETDKYAWVSLSEAKTHNLIDGIYDEIVMVENKRKGSPRFGEAGVKSEWQRFSANTRKKTTPAST